MIAENRHVNSYTCLQYTRSVWEVYVPALTLQAHHSVKSPLRLSFLSTVYKKQRTGFKLSLTCMCSLDVYPKRVVGQDH